MHHPLYLVPLIILPEARYFDLALLVFPGVVSSECLLEVTEPAVASPLALGAPSAATAAGNQAFVKSLFLCKKQLLPDCGQGASQRSPTCIRAFSHSLRFWFSIFDCSSIKTRAEAFTREFHRPTAHSRIEAPPGPCNNANSMEVTEKEAYGVGISRSVTTATAVARGGSGTDRAEVVGSGCADGQYCCQQLR